MQNRAQAPVPIIERASVDDAEVILALQLRAYLVEAVLYNDDTIAPLRETVVEVRMACAEQRILKVVLDGTVAGTVRMHQVGDTCHVGRLIVDPDRQNRGLGSALLRAVETHCAPGTRLELFTGHLSERNLYLYRKHGYREFRREVATPALTFVYLEKQV